SARGRSRNAVVLGVLQVLATKLDSVAYTGVRRRFRGWRIPRAAHVLRPCRLTRGAGREALDQLVPDVRGEVGVAHGLHDRPVTEPLLDLPHRDPPHRPVGGEGVPE